MRSVDVTFRPIEQWPAEPTKSWMRKRAPFRSKYSDTLDLLDRELHQISAKNIVLQVDLREDQIRVDGMPKSGARWGEPGVILAFDSKAGPLQFPCDTFNKWEDNLRAIALALEALRKVDRYGVTQTSQQYSGWRKLEDPNAAPSFATVERAAEYLAEMTSQSASSILNDQAIAKSSYKRGY